MPRTGDVIENPVAKMRLRFLRTAAETGGESLEMEAAYEPGSLEALEHFHPRQDERFEILSGTMRVRKGREERDLSQGETLEIPARTRHAMWNPGTAEARVRWLTTPALRTAEFFETTFAMARDGRLTANGPRNPLLAGALLWKFRREFRLTSPPTLIQAIALPPLAGLARVMGQRP
jgi:mannose-6-phosphate isomerase-like protein (cupin superfamily)